MERFTGEGRLWKIVTRILLFSGDGIGGNHCRAIADQWRDSANQHFRGKIASQVSLLQPGALNRAGISQ